MGQVVALLVLIILFSIPEGDPALDHPKQPHYQDLPAVVTWYDPARGGINCNEDCTTVADGTKVTEELYGVTAACDQRLLGRIIKIGSIGEFRCRDTGGMIKPTWSKHYQRWVLYFDIMLHENPEWNYWLFEDWRIVG